MEFEHVLICLLDLEGIYAPMNFITKHWLDFVHWFFEEMAKMNLIEIMAEILVGHVENAIISILIRANKLSFLSRIINVAPELLIILVTFPTPLLLSPRVTKLNHSLVIHNLATQSYGIQLQ